MNDRKVIFCTNRNQWRDWLSKHYETEKEIWFVFPSVSSGEKGVSYNDAVEEALCFGWIDGAGPYKTFMQIVLPSSGASNITVLVFSIVWYWNDYYQGQIYLSSDFPMSVVLSNFNNNLTLVNDLHDKFSFTTGTLLLTCCLISIIPVLIFFLFMQKKFVQSIATCGIVG